MSKRINAAIRIFNTPLLIEQNKLDIISSEIGIKLLEGVELNSNVATPVNKQTPQTSISIIKVFDSLVAKGGAGESGFTTYESIRNQINTAINDGASKIGFYIDSPGGEANGAFALTDFINSIPNTYGVETFAFSDGMLTSGAYAIGAATQKLYITDSANVGSIGAIMSLVDVTEADRKEGYKYTIIRSVSEKAVYNPHEKLTNETVSVMSEKLNAIGDLFSQKITSYRKNLTLKDIADFNGKTYMGEEALKLNLVDEIVSSINDVINIESTNTTSTQSNKGTIMTLEELKSQLSAKETELATLQNSVTSAVAKATTDERVRILDILATAKTLKISDDLVTKRISAGTSVEDSKDIFTAIAEALGAATIIETSTGLTTTVTDPKTTSNKIDVEGVEVSVADILSFAKGAK